MKINYKDPFLKIMLADKEELIIVCEKTSNMTVVYNDGGHIMKK